MFAHEVAIALTKMLHMSIAGSVVFLLGCFGSLWLNKLYMSTERRRRTKKTWSNSFLKVLIFMSLIYVFHYIVRNIINSINDNFIKYILFWRNSIAYDTTRLKSLNGGIATAFSIMNFMTLFKEDVTYVFTSLPHRRHHEQSP